jgi:hypothetical protein
MALALRPAELPGCHAQHLPEMSGQMTLVGKARGQCDVRHWKLRASQHLPCSLDTPVDEIVVRRHSCRLLERSGKMVHRKSRDGSQLCEIHALAQMHFHVFPHPAHGPWRKTPAGGRAWRPLPDGSERIQAGPRVQRVAPSVLPNRPPRSGGVTRAGQISSVPETMSCAVKSPPSRLRKSVGSLSNKAHRLTPFRSRYSSSRREVRAVQSAR